MDTMSGLERILAVLAGSEPDRVPTFEWSINDRVRQGLHPGSSPFDFVDLAGLDGVVVYEDQRKTPAGPGAYRDEWGIIYAVTAEDYPSPLGYPLADLPSEDASADAEIDVPDPLDERRFESLKEAVRRFKGRKAILFRLRDAFSLPRNLRGMQNLMMDFVLAPELVRKLVELSIGFNLETARRAMELGADIFWSSDDYCDNRGPMMGPDIWKEFILPGLGQLVGEIRREGYPFIKHNDGNIVSILPAMVETGISCIDPIDSEAGMDLAAVKREYGDRLAIKGGLPVGRALCDGNRETVRSAVRECLQAAGAGGGYILSSSSDIIAAVKPENYLAMLEANREFGRYPLQLD